MHAVMTQGPQTTVTNCVRVFSNRRDGRDPMAGIEATRSQVIFRGDRP